MILTIYINIGLWIYSIKKIKGQSISSFYIKNIYTLILIFFFTFISGYGSNGLSGAVVAKSSLDPHSHLRHQPGNFFKKNLV